MEWYATFLILQVAKDSHNLWLTNQAISPKPVDRQNVLNWNGRTMGINPRGIRHCGPEKTLSTGDNFLSNHYKVHLNSGRNRTIHSECLCLRKLFDGNPHSFKDLFIRVQILFSQHDTLRYTARIKYLFHSQPWTRILSLMLVKV